MGIKWKYISFDIINECTTVMRRSRCLHPFDTFCEDIMGTCPLIHPNCFSLRVRVVYVLGEMRVFLDFITLGSGHSPRPYNISKANFICKIQKKSQCILMYMYMRNAQKIHWSEWASLKNAGTYWNVRHCWCQLVPIFLRLALPFKSFCCVFPRALIFFSLSPGM